MKLILFSDLHAHNYREHSTTVETKEYGPINSRLWNTMQVLRKIRAYAKKHKIKNVACGGDLFHVRGVYRTHLYNVVFNEVSKFKEDGIDLLIIPGNHDQADLAGQVHSLEPMKAIANVIDEPQTVVLKDKGGDLLVRCIPFRERPEDIQKAMKEIKAPPGVARYDKNLGMILLAHIGIDGASSGPVEYRPKEELSPDDIASGWDFVFLGHYHKQQRIKKGVWYIGSPLQQNRGERNEKRKGFIVYNSKTKKFKNVPLGMPEFVTVNADDVGEPGTEEITRGNFVDVEVDVSVYDVESVVDWLRNKDGAAHVNVIPITSEKTRAVEKRLDVDPTMSMEVMVQKYTDQYAPEGLDKDRIVEEARKLLEEVS